MTPIAQPRSGPGRQPGLVEVRAVATAEVLDVPTAEGAVMDRGVLAAHRAFDETHLAARVPADPHPVDQRDRASIRQPEAVHPPSSAVGQWVRSALMLAPRLRIASYCASSLTLLRAMPASIPRRSWSA